MEGNCRKGFAVVWFLYLSTCEGKWNGSEKVLMLEDIGPYLLLSALSLFLLLDLFADLLPCWRSGRYFSPVPTPPLLEDQLLWSWNWPTTTLGHLFHTPELCKKDWGNESFLSMARTCYRNGKPSFQILCWHFSMIDLRVRLKPKWKMKNLARYWWTFRLTPWSLVFLIWFEYLQNGDAGFSCWIVTHS